MKEYVKPVAESWDIVWETANVQGCSSQELLTVAKIMMGLDSDLTVLIQTL